MMNLNITKLFCIGLVLLTSFVSADVITGDAMELKSKEVDFVNKSVNRPAKIKFWYQGSAEPCKATICLSPKQSRHQIAIISHGAFGSPREMNWLGYALASRGWVVVGVAHFGESWVYGAENIDPSSVMRFWQRPQDISFAIDSLSKEGLFNISLKTDLENDFLPYSTHAKYYANHIQGANLIGLEQGAGHFVYIDKCDSDREVKGVSLCKDREGVDRVAIQKQILDYVFSFIYGNGFS